MSTAGSAVDNDLTETVISNQNDHGDSDEDSNSVSFTGESSDTTDENDTKDTVTQDANGSALNEDVEDSPQMEHIEDLPQTEHIEDSPQMEHIEDSPQMEHIEDSPQMERIEDSPQMEHIEDSPQTEHIEDSPQMEHIEDSPQTAHIEDSPNYNDVDHSASYDHASVDESPATEHSFALNEDMDIGVPIVDSEHKVQHHWYDGSRKRELRMMRELEEDQRAEQRKLRKELRGSDWRRKLGTSSVIRIKLPQKSKYQCKVNSPLAFDTAEQRLIDIGRAQRVEYMKKLQANVIKGTRKHLGLSSTHDDAEVSPVKSVGCHDDSYVFGSSTRRSDSDLGGKQDIKRIQRNARDMKRWRAELLRNTKPDKAKLNLVHLRRILDKKAPRLWSITDDGFGLRMPTPPTSAVTLGHLTVLDVDALQSFGLLRKYKTRPPHLIVFKEIAKSRLLIHVRKHGRKSPFWPHRKKIKAYAVSSMSLLILRVESSPDPKTAKFWVSLTKEGREVLEDCLRELMKQVTAAIKKAKIRTQMYGFTSTDIDFASSASIYDSNSPEQSPEHSLIEDDGDAEAATPERHGGGDGGGDGDGGGGDGGGDEVEGGGEGAQEGEEPVMYKDSTGDFFMEY